MRRIPGAKRRGDYEAKRVAPTSESNPNNSRKRSFAEEEQRSGAKVRSAKRKGIMSEAEFAPTVA